MKAKKPKVKNMQAIHSKHHKKCGIGIILLGILILINQQFAVVNWPNFWGIILILVGIKAIMIHRNCC